MDFDEALLDIDYLIYSSHKSATQTVSRTLGMNGNKCIHCHSLTDETTNLEPGSFASFLEHYHSVNSKKLTILTTFREPLERHISSFFQWYGEGVIRKKIAHGMTDTIIHKASINELQMVFINELSSHNLAGQSESIDEICNELNFRISDMHYGIDEQHGLHELNDCRLFLLRFDTLIYEKS